MIICSCCVSLVWPGYSTVGFFFLQNTNKHTRHSYRGDVGSLLCIYRVWSIFVISYTLCAISCHDWPWLREPTWVFLCVFFVITLETQTCIRSPHRHLFSERGCTFKRTIKTFRLPLVSRVYFSWRHWLSYCWHKIFSAITLTYAVSAQGHFILWESACVQVGISMRMTWISKYIPQFMRGKIICLCSAHLLAAQNIWI